jgi:hypothetical protein
VRIFGGDVEGIFMVMVMVMVMDVVIIVVVVKIIVMDGYSNFYGYCYGCGHV